MKHRDWYSDWSDSDNFDEQKKQQKIWWEAHKSKTSPMFETKTKPKTEPEPDDKYEPKFTLLDLLVLPFRIVLGLVTVVFCVGACVSLYFNETLNPQKYRKKP